MGLYDRDWFWEDADRRYDNSPTKKTSKSPKQNNQKPKTAPVLPKSEAERKLDAFIAKYGEGNYDVKQVYCKRCLKVFDCAFPKRKQKKLYLGLQYDCPNCNHTNYIDHWRKVLFDVVVVVVAFAIFVGLLFLFAI